MSAAWAVVIGRNAETVLGWIHTSNASGPDALRYQRSGGGPPFFRQAQARQIGETVRSGEPRPMGARHGLPGYGWTLHKVQHWVKQVFQCAASRNVLPRILKQGRLSWKQWEQVLKQAKPA